MTVFDLFNRLGRPYTVSPWPWASLDSLLGFSGSGRDSRAQDFLPPFRDSRSRVLLPFLKRNKLAVSVLDFSCEMNVALLCRLLKTLMFPRNTFALPVYSRDILDILFGMK